jgi:hypothetical protein
VNVTLDLLLQEKSIDCLISLYEEKVLRKYLVLREGAKPEDFENHVCSYANFRRLLIRGRIDGCDI